MKKLILFLLVMIGCAQAQYMTVTASGCLVDGSGATIATGTLTILGTDQNNNPIPYRAGSAFQATTVPIVRTITAGGLASSLQLADPLTTSPTNILYWFRLQDNASKKITDYKGIILQANDVFTGGHFTQFNICKMNPLPQTSQVSYATTPTTNNASENITGDLNVQGTATFTGASSKLGIGTASPAAPLDIKYTDNTQAVWLRRASNNNPTHKFEDDASGNGSMDIAADGAAKIHLTSAASASSWIVNNGFFGIGTGSPSAYFHVVRGTNGAGYGTVAKFSSNLLDENVEIITRASAISSIGTSTANAFSIYANNIEGVRFDSSVADMNVINGVLPDGLGFKHKRVTSCTTAASLGAACGTTVVWGTPFVDAAYTVTCSIENSGNLLFLNNLSSKGSGSITVVLENTPGSSTAATGTIDCIAIHD